MTPPGTVNCGIPVRYPLSRSVVFFFKKKKTTIAYRQNSVFLLGFMRYAIAVFLKTLRYYEYSSSSQLSACAAGIPRSDRKKILLSRSNSAGTVPASADGSSTFAKLLSHCTVPTFPCLSYYRHTHFTTTTRARKCNPPGL